MNLRTVPCQLRHSEASDNRDQPPPHKRLDYEARQMEAAEFDRSATRSTSQLGVRMPPVGDPTNVAKAVSGAVASQVRFHFKSGLQDCGTDTCDKTM